MLMIDELETVTAPWDWSAFATGVGLGIAIGMLACGGA
jgi:hypothetical protein